MPDYIPRKDSALSSWLKTFKVKLSGHGTDLGLTTAEVTALENMCDELAGKIQNVYNKKAELQSIVADKKTTLVRNIRAIRKASNRMKVHPDYSVASGKDMGIEAPSAARITTEYKPVIRVKVMPDYVRLSYRKKGVDAMDIYRRRGNEKEMTLIGRDAVSPYLDKTPLAQAGVPEKRVYAIAGVINDEVVGQFSDEAEVVFGG